MKTLRYALLGLTCLLFTASSRPANTPKDNLVATVNRLQDEVNNIKLETETLIYKGRKLLVERKTLIEDMDKVIRKIDNHEITYWNDEIEDVNRRIGDLYDKSAKITHKGKALRHRKAAVECELNAKAALPRLKRLVHVDGLQESINEWNSFLKEYNPQVNIYNDRADDLKSKVNKLLKR